MSTRQYIGARYVPKFFDWDGSAEWRSGVAYEALTIVTRNGNSYTSKIPVPSNIGAPESNPTYWVATGLYNEQLESIRDAIITAQGDIDTLDGRMDTAENDIDSLEGRMNTAESNISVLTREVITRRYVLVGDSYSEGSTYGGTATGWSGIFKNLSGLGNSDCYIFDYGGSGFVGHNTNTFEQLLVNNYSSVSNPNTITDVVFAGGYNDNDATIAALDTAIANAISRARTLFPNANIWVAMIGYSTSTDSTVRENLVNIALHYKNIGLANKAIYVCDSDYLLPLNPVSYMSGDNMHPSQEGYNILGRSLYAAINERTGCVPITCSPVNTNITLTGESGITCQMEGVNGPMVQILGRSKRIYLPVRPHAFIFTPSRTIEWQDTIDLASFNHSVYGLNNYRYTAKPVNAWIKSDGKFYLVYGTIFIRHGKLCIYFENLENGSNIGKNYDLVSELSFGSTFVDFDSRLI